MSLAMVATAAAAASMVAVSPAVSPPCPVALVHSRFAPAAEAASRTAVTYNTKLVPTSAMVVVVEFLGKPRYEHGHDHGHQHYRMQGEARSTPTGTPTSTPSGSPSPQAGQEGTSVMVWLHGAKANHTFGAHVHTKTCGTKPDDSGPHYQNTKDPKQPSTNPKYANPHNEVWLTLKTDSSGDAHAMTHVNWRFRDSQARSFVIHEHGTATQKGKAGMAGARVACVKVPFKGYK